MKKIISFFAVATLLFSSCSRDYIEPYPSPTRYLLTVHNNTDNDIIWFVPDHGDVDCDAVTGALPETLNARLEENFYSSKARSYNNFYITEGGVSCPLETYHKDDKVTFYFFDAKVFESTDWATIVADELWLARYTYSAEDVIRMDKKITYPEAK